MATWQHLRSSTANKRPTTSLADGRIAINTNTASPGLFFKDSAGTGIVKVGPVHVGTTAPNSVPAAGGSSGNYTGEQWLDTSVSPAQMKVWNGSTWVGIVADELPVSKLQDGAARQLIQTDAAGTGVEWTSNVDVPGTLDVTSTATFDSIAQHPLGTAGAPTITFTGDNNTGIYSPGADQVAISTGGFGRLFVDASGLVGIGTSSPGALFSLAGSSAYTVGNSGLATQGLDVNASAGGSGLFGGALSFGVGGIGRASISAFQGAADNDVVGLVFNVHTSGTAAADAVEAMRIDSSGRLLIGTFTNTSTAGASSTVQVASSNPFTALRWNAGANPSTITLGQSRGAAPGTLSIASNNDLLSRIQFVGDDGTQFVSAASITAAVDGIPGTNDMPGRLVFSTTADGASTPTERMRISNAGTTTLTSAASTAPFIANIGASEVARIDSSGRLLVGTSSARSNFFNASTSSSVQVEGTTTDNSAIAIIRNSANSSSPLINFAKSRSTSVSGNTLVANGDQLGAIWFQGADGTEFVPGASIQGVVDGTPGADDMPGRLVFSTRENGGSSPTERMRITSAGNVGIGTASPGELLTVANAPNTDATIKDVAYFCGNYASNSGSGARILIGGDIPSVTNRGVALVGVNTGGAGNAHDMVFEVSGTAAAPSERARIDSSGRLLVGISSAMPLQTPLSSSTLGTPRYLQADTAQAEASAFWSAYSTTSTVAPNLLLGRSRGTLSAQGLVSDGDSLGRIVFLGSDGQAVGTNAGFIRAAVIEGQVDGTASAGVMPGRIVFSTTSNGPNPTERLRIANDGRHTINSNAHQGTALTTTAPANLYTSTGTYTDTSTAASGTVTHGTIVAFDNPAIAASNLTVTYTNASTVYIDGAPTAGTNVTVTNPYALYVNAGTSFFGGNVNLSTGNEYRINNTKVVGARVTGWTAATGTATRTTFATSTVTTAQLAERVKALIDDLISHGLIGT